MRPGPAQSFSPDHHGAQPMACSLPVAAGGREDPFLWPFDPQYLWLIGSSSAGNSVITLQPLSVTTTSSSMRAAE